MEYSHSPCSYIQPMQETLHKINIHREMCPFCCSYNIKSLHMGLTIIKHVPELLQRISIQHAIFLYFSSVIHDSAISVVVLELLDVEPPPNNIDYFGSTLSHVFALFSMKRHFSINYCLNQISWFSLHCQYVKLKL